MYCEATINLGISNLTLFHLLVEGEYFVYCVLFF